MSRPKNPIPSYRLHRQSGQAVATVNVKGVRKEMLLGIHGSPEAQEEYERLLARLRAGGLADAIGRGNGPDLTISELVCT